jgi:site-specific recombinase XerD
MRLGRARESYVRWLEVGRDLSPHTLRAYDGDLGALERHLGPEAPVRRLDGHCLIDFVETQRASGLSPASLRRRVSGLRGFCGWLVASRLLDADPWAGVEISLGRSRRLPRALPTQELNRLLAFLRDAAGVPPTGVPDETLARPHAATTLLGVSLMVATGVRVNEAVGIRCDDIDLRGGSVRLLGKGRRERHVFLPNEWITDLTAAYLRTRADLCPAHPQLLFGLRRQPLSTAAMRSRLAKAARAAGLETRVTPHMLRHTAATQLIEAGVDIRYIQRLLGHASLTTTEIYTHVSDSALKHVVSNADVLGGLSFTDN